jgi:hypothetical protein
MYNLQLLVLILSLSWSKYVDIIVSSFLSLLSMYNKPFNVHCSSDSSCTSKTTFPTRRNQPMKFVSNITPMIIYMNFTEHKVFIVKLLVSKGKIINKKKPANVK